MKALTTRQREIIEIATEYEHHTGLPCRFSYLAQRLDIAPVAVRHHAEALYRKGWLSDTRSPVRVVCRRGLGEPKN